MKKNYFTSPLIVVILFSVLVQLVSCNTTDQEKVTFFRGKIKNPKGEYVYFSQGKKILDSAKLDNNNKFSFKLDSIKIGLYTFNHGAEFQYLYLEPQDSLLIYLNTWDFDESLIFSGKGSAKNNYLINAYLQQEKNEKAFKPHFQLEEQEFTKHIDKGIKKQLAVYNEFLSNETESPSPFFDKLAKTGIYFPFYFLKEYYPFNYKWYKKMDKFPEVSDEFYSFRNEIDLNDESLLNYATYTIYIRTFLYHMAYELKNDQPEYGNIQLNFMQAVIDKITIESLKNEFLATSAWRTLSDESLSEKDRKDINDYFFTHCTNEQFITELKISAVQRSKLKKGDTLPKLMVTNHKGEQVLINSMAKDNKTVIYFWPKNFTRVEMLNEKLHKLQKKFPDILFIGIERNKNDGDWNAFIKDKHLAHNTQFKISKNAECYSWFEGDMARTIIVNQEGHVQNSYLFFNDKYFDKHLKELKKQ